MSSPGSNENHQQCSNIDIINGIGSSASLKISKRSFSIKKSSPSSSSSSPSPPPQPQPPPLPANGAKDASKPSQRRPVIIYTHSPKIIHTNPEDFMALVQKLTGWSGPNNDESKGKMENEDSQEEKSTRVVGNDECEASSIVVDERCNGIENVPLNSSCFVTPILEPPRPYMMPNNVPIYPPNSADLCSNQPYYNCIDPLVLAPPSIVPRSFPPYPNLPKSNNEFHIPRY